MEKPFQGSGRTFRRCAALVGIAAVCLSAAPNISSVTKNSDTVGKYAKLELTVNLTTVYANPYDPDQIDLSATFTAPSGATWKINGFYGVDASNNSSWKIRFAPDETGAWSYTVQQPIPPEQPRAFQEVSCAVHPGITDGYGSRRTADTCAWMTARPITA